MLTERRNKVSKKKKDGGTSRRKQGWMAGGKKSERKGRICQREAERQCSSSSVCEGSASVSEEEKRMKWRMEENEKKEESKG